MQKHILTLSIVLFSLLNANAQEIKPTSAQARIQSYQHKQNMAIHPLVNELDFVSIGPVIMSGRVTDIDANPENPNEFYVSYASGGLWKTTDNGNSFNPLFDYQPSLSMGDIAIDWKHNETIWVGTGENNSSRSSYAGLGVYKSTDRGQTWQNMGLNETNHIGRIVIHPENPDVVWVAAMGHLYSRNPERGVFKTSDGGKTWTKTLFVNVNTGAIDLVVNPKNPEILYAAMWERRAWKWDRQESGSGSGIYKSTDGGTSWVKISGDKFGFPEHENVGRIGLAIFPENPDILYAYLDNLTPLEADKDEDKLHLDDLNTLSKEEFLAVDDKSLKKFLKKNYLPKDVEFVKSKIRADKWTVKDLYNYRVDTNYIAAKKVIGVEIYRTNNGGEQWFRTHDKNYDGPLFSYSYGYYFGEIRVSAINPDKIYVGGLVFSKSKNGGKKLKPQLRLNVHMDHQAIWVNPNDDKHIINGNDGGINITCNGGRSWDKINPIPVGQFYSVNVDMEKPYNVYGGLQDNGVWMGPSDYDVEANYSRKRSKYPYKRIGGGDGMEVQIDNSNGLKVYTGSQFGMYSLTNYEEKKEGQYKRDGRKQRIYPYHNMGESPLRRNWKTPILISKHNTNVYYYGANKLYRSTDNGRRFEAVSEDLSRIVRRGDIPNGTITAIDESPLREGLLYAGTDDGQVWVSTDSCKTWTNISSGLPVDFKVYSIDASAFSEGRVYLAMNGYYSDNFEPLLFVSNNYGKNWQSIASNLPLEPINKILEDPVNENLLYIGTDNGLYISVDKGKNYSPANRSLPFVAVHDLIVHPREHDLIVATHGRSLYKVNVEKLQREAGK